jgi:hypothetical protein
MNNPTLATAMPVIRLAVNFNLRARYPINGVTSLRRVDSRPSCHGIFIFE